MPASTRNSRSPATESSRPGTEYGDRENGSLSGNLTRNPELRFTQTGRAVANCAVAVNERIKNEKTGQWQDTEPEFYEITVWGQQAEHFTESLVKGDRIVATGFFQEETYINRNGEKVTTTRFTAQDIGPSMLFSNVVIKKATRSK